MPDEIVGPTEWCPPQKSEGKRLISVPFSVKFSYRVFHEALSNTAKFLSGETLVVAWYTSCIFNKLLISN